MTARGASYCIKGKIYRACVQSVLACETETWAMKRANLYSLERVERMMVRWMCGVLLKDRKRSVICTVFWVYIVWRMWWGVADWGGLGIWSVRVGMIGYRPVERWRWQGRGERGGKGRLGKNVWIKTWKCLVYILNGRYSYIRDVWRDFIWANV